MVRLITWYPPCVRASGREVQRCLRSQQPPRSPLLADDLDANRTALLRRLAMAESRIELPDQFLGGIRNHRARREDRLCTGRVESVIVLRRHHAAEDDHDVFAPL